VGQDARSFREGHTQTSFEYRFRKPDGTYAYILERGYILYNGRAVPVRMVGSMADLSPLRKAQEELEEKALALQQFNAELEESGAALRESLSKFQAVFDSNMIGIFFWNLSGAVIDANDEFLAATGYSRQDLESGRLNWAHLTPEDHRPADEKALAEIRRTGVNVPYEKEYFRKDGSRVPVIVAAPCWKATPTWALAFCSTFPNAKRPTGSCGTRWKNSKTQLRTRHVRLQGVARPAGPAGFHPGAHQHPQGGAGPEHGSPLHCPHGKPGRQAGRVHPVDPGPLPHQQHRGAGRPWCASTRSSGSRSKTSGTCPASRR
jgi:PAS domain S-box-containing protein